MGNFFTLMVLWIPAGKRKFEPLTSTVWLDPLNRPCRSFNWAETHPFARYFYHILPYYSCVYSFLPYFYHIFTIFYHIMLSMFIVVVYLGVLARCVFKVFLFGVLGWNERIHQTFQAMIRSLALGFSPYCLNIFEHWWISSDACFYSFYQFLILSLIILMTDVLSANSLRRGFNQRLPQRFLPVSHRP